MELDKIIDLFVDFAGIFMMIYTDIKFFSVVIKDENIKLNISRIIYIIIFLILIYYNGTYNYTITKGFLFLFLYSIFNKFYFKKELIDSLLVSSMYYLTLIIFELLLSIFIWALPFVGVEIFDQSHILKTLFTFLISLFVLLFIYLKRVKIKLREVYSHIISRRKILIYLFLLVILLFFLIVSFKNSSEVTTVDYVVNLSFILLVSMFLFIINHQNNKMKSFEEKQNAMLEFMNEYEKIIDEARITKHEALNNLLLLKSFPNKNSDKYEKILSDLIGEYDTTSVSVKNIYKLPSGLKGLFYYKLHHCLQSRANVKILISNKITPLLDAIDEKTYMKIYKILGILLDNAVESSLKTKEKHLLIDIYETNKNIIFHIENSYEGKIDINRINSKNYSTKGKQRGYGLYVLNRIVANSNNLEIKQEVNNKIYQTEIVYNKK